MEDEIVCEMKRQRERNGENQSAVAQKLLDCF